MKSSLHLQLAIKLSWIICPTKPRKVLGVGYKIWGEKRVSWLLLQYQLNYLLITAMKKIGKYEILKPIGKGSFGQVFLVACDNQQYALKTISKRPHSAREIRSLSEETQLLTKLKHENIIAMKESFETPEEVVVVMEYAGDDLSRLLEKGRLSEERVRDYGRQILAAMLYLHENKVVHRDLKPQNILLQGGQIKLCDFGFAKKMSAATNFLQSIKGTPLYIAPQILQKKNYSHKVDVWSFGIILYELASGRTPFHAATIQQLQPKILHEAVKFPVGMSSSLKDLIDGMLQKNDKKRLDWDQVSLHPFFLQESVKTKQVIIQKAVERERVEKVEAVKAVKWVAQEECAYLRRVEEDLEEGRIKLVDLKFDQEFSLRVVQFLGEACLDRTRIPRQTLFVLLQRIIKIAKTKDVREGCEELTRKRAIMTAIVTVALDQQQDQLLSVELELIGYLLQQNFDKIQIDTEHDDQITMLIARKLTGKTFPKATNNCLKVLGILTSQALLTLNNSLDYFTRLAQEKLLTIVAEYYSPASESAIVLEVLQKFIHPRYERTSPLTHASKAIFRAFKQEVTPILLRKGLIGEESPVGRPWKTPSHLQVYCEIVYELLTISQEARNAFLGHGYWRQLLGNGKTKVIFLGMVQAVLSGSGIFQLSSEVIQNQIVVQPSGNKLINAFLIYFTPQHFGQQAARAGNTAKRIQKLKITIAKIAEFLTVEQALKSKWCKDLLGFFAEDGKFFDDLLVQTLYSLTKDCKEEEVLAAGRTVAQEALLLPLSEESLSLCLEIMERQMKPWSAVQLKRLDEYFGEMAKNEGFEDYLSYNPLQCGKLLTRLLRVQCGRLDEEMFQQQMAQLIERTQLLRFLFSEQLVNEQLLLLVLKLTNRIIARLKNIDFLAHGALQQVKKHFKTTGQELKVETLVFCSHLARLKAEYCHQLLQSGIVAICYRGLGDERQLILQKALHLIGNLSKHNVQAFEQFQKYQIVHLINKRIAGHYRNKKILKNTIYAIGNIAFYGERFAFQIRETSKYLLEGLVSDDPHLLLNTVSTISNLLRHSSYHLQALLENGVFSRLMELYASASTPEQVSYVNNAIRKAANYVQFFKAYPKDVLKGLFENNLRRGFLKENDSNVKWLSQKLIS